VGQEFEHEFLCLVAMKNVRCATVEENCVEKVGGEGGGRAIMETFLVKLLMIARASVLPVMS
jgi:hypothetical protein